MGVHLCRFSAQDVLPQVERALERLPAESHELAVAAPDVAIEPSASVELQVTNQLGPVET